MVKAYLRYDFASAFGVITSAGNPEFDAEGKHIYTTSLENISVWNVKQGTKVSSLAPSSSTTPTQGAAEATVIARAKKSQLLAVGYSDGTVRLWDLTTSLCTVTLKGHKSSVTALRYHPSGSLLASGSKDTDLILWDVVEETGLYRLRGHKDQITDLVFLTRGNRLISCSKDGLVKVWDLSTQHCSQTVAGYKAEVWSLDLDPQERRLVTGSTDHELRVFQVVGLEEEEEANHVSAAEPTTVSGKGEADGKKAGDVRTGHHYCLRAMGSVKRQAGGHERVSRLRFDEAGTMLACLGTGKSVELFRIRSEAESKKKLKRRKKRRREKMQKKSDKENDNEEQEEMEEQEDVEKEGENEPRATDEFEPFQVVACKSKIRSFAFAPSAALRNAKQAGSKGSGSGGGRDCLARLALSLSNNVLELVDVLAPAGLLRSEKGFNLEEVTQEVVQKLDQGGHRADIRTVALSNDDQQLLSASNNAVKVWNPQTGACLATMESGYGLCTLFAPGNSHAVLGTKEGKLEVFDLGASTRSHVEEDAHDGPIWSLCALPDRTGFVSGSADKTVKFWQWKVVVSGDGLKQLRLQHIRTLKMADDVLCVRVSPDSRLLAVSLLDSTIKVFYLDTLKFFLSLYGHKLPVLCMDISSDSTLLVSGSADKNIKVWGLDFGDCHKSMFAHGDTVMQVAFVHNTHYCFTVGKDRLVKYWDVDRHEMLMEMPGHHAEVWALAVSSYGDFVITGSHDRSLRRWDRTQEPFFVEEEREKRLESMFEADLERGGADVSGAGGEGEPDGTGSSKGAEEGTAASAGRKTLDSVSAADNIIEALEMAAHEVERHKEAAAADIHGAPKAPPMNPLMLGLTPSAYVLRAVVAVKSADLESALLMLPFSDALRLLTYLPEWLQQSAGGAHAELSCRTAVLLLRLHHAQLVATAGARHVLLKLRRYLRPAVQALKDTSGFNAAGLRHIQRLVKERSSMMADD